MSIAIGKFYINPLFKPKQQKEMETTILFQKLEKRNDGSGYHYFLTTDESLPDFTPVDKYWLQVLKLLAISELDDNECTQQTLQNIRELLTECFSTVQQRQKFNLVIQELKHLHGYKSNISDY